MLMVAFCSSSKDIPEAVSPSSSEDAETPMAEEVDKLGKLVDYGSFCTFPNDLHPFTVLIVANRQGNGPGRKIESFEFPANRVQLRTDI